MRLSFLRLQNFRQHADSYIEFQLGLTGIIGPNGAGKSTILEAIAWAIYGSSAARGTNDTLRFVRAGARSRVAVELGFELGGHAYRVVRTPNQAEVFLDGGIAPVAATLGGVSTYLQGRLGMAREEFFNTYFTGQKELQFLAAMGAADRGRFLSQVLGYERLREAQELVRSRRNELRHEVRALRAALPDREVILAERAGAEQRVAGALRELADAETERVAAANAAANLAPRWADAQMARERFRELVHRSEAAEQERAAAQREGLRIQGELESIAAAEGELAPLRTQLVPLPALVTEMERWEGLARTEERRKAFARQLEELDAELARGRERMAKLEKAPELVLQIGAELEALRAARARLEAELDTRKSAWLKDQQDAQTKLQNFRERGAELKEQMQQVRELGAEGPCPTCGRPLGRDYERLLGELNEQWAAVVQDGKWWKHRHDQLAAKPDEIKRLEAELAAQAAQIDERARKHVRCEAAVQEKAGLQNDWDERGARRAELARQIAELPGVYDVERHRAMRAELQALRLIETRATRLEATVARRSVLEREREQARTREAAAATRSTATAAERDALGFSEPAFLALQEEQAAATRRVHGVEIRVTELRGVLAAAEQARTAAERAQAELAERVRQVELQEEEQRYHDELDSALSTLRNELNNHVRPELSELASNFLTELTDGRYTSLEIDDQYNILVLDEGEEKPVISGGEEDVTNLVLRLAMSQMIAERAGHPLSLLILDEVFGSLDVARRDNVVQLLHRLQDQFDQVILITHIDGIRESLDQVLRVEFDERTGASRVADESPGGGDPSWEPGLAAD
ncbi:DNA double-strand break repair ATPase Rad50 [soil metagenome]